MNAGIPRIVSSVACGDEPCDLAWACLDGLSVAPFGGLVVGGGFGGPVAAWEGCQWWFLSLDAGSTLEGWGLGERDFSGDRFVREHADEWNVKGVRDGDGFVEDDVACPGFDAEDDRVAEANLGSECSLAEMSASARFT